MLHLISEPLRSEIYRTICIVYTAQTGLPRAEEEVCVTCVRLAVVTVCLVCEFASEVGVDAVTAAGCL